MAGGRCVVVVVVVLDSYRLESILKQQTPVTVMSSSMRGMLGMMM